MLLITLHGSCSILAGDGCPRCYRHALTKHCGCFTAQYVVHATQSLCCCAACFTVFFHHNNHIQIRDNLMHKVCW